MAGLPATKSTRKQSAGVETELNFFNYPFTQRIGSMPNIEIHGTCDDGFFDRSVSDEIGAKIKEIFTDWPCATSMVITTVHSQVRDLQGNPQPYLRVWDTDEEEGEKIAFRLRLEGFDVEFKMLDAFLPKPMYTLEEILEELKLLTGEDYFSRVKHFLLQGDSDRAIEVLDRCTDTTAKCPAEKIPSPDLMDTSEAASIARNARRIQMLDILSI